MITKNDCMSILIKLEDNGIDINKPMRQLASAREIPIEVLKFISQNRGFEIANFYEMLRIRHNKSKSPLYTNIVRGLDDIDEVVTTLTSLLTQISLYSRKLDNTANFFKEARAEEIARVLNNYFATGDTTGCMAVLKFIKADLLVLEHIADRRELVA